MTEITGGHTLYSDLRRIWQQLESAFSTIGLQGITLVNFIDGIRIVFKENKIVYHLRPSGNAPEFRSYVTANSYQEAESVIKKRAVLIRSLINLMDQG